MRIRLLVAALAVVAVGAGAYALAQSDGNRSTADHAASTSATTIATTASPSVTSATSKTSAATSTMTSAMPTASAMPPAARAGGHRLARLVAQHPSGSVSVAAYDLSDGQQVGAGARGGMLEASVAKVRLLETLLFVRERAGRALSARERDLAEDMIEDSDNDAANSLYYALGGVRVLRSTERALGLDPAVLRLGPGVLWGLTLSSARQQVVLLHNLVAPSSPLSAAGRKYAMSLMRHVESGQSWGVPAVADGAFAVKNGWLAVGADDGLWAVNSDGVVRVHDRTLLISVMTQHNASMADGVALVERLARAAAAVLTAYR